MLKIPCAEGLTRQQIALPVFDARKIETIHPRRRLKTFCRVYGQNALEQPLHSINSPNSRSRVSGRDTQAREPRPYAKSNILPLKRIPPFCCWRRQALGAGPSARQASRRSFFSLPFQSAIELAVHRTRSEPRSPLCARTCCPITHLINHIHGG